MYLYTHTRYSKYINCVCVCVDYIVCVCVEVCVEVKVKVKVGPAVPMGTVVEKGEMCQVAQIESQWHIQEVR